MAEAEQPQARQHKTIKAMDEAAWNAAIEHCRARDEKMSDFAARAFRQMIERDRAAPMLLPPDERAALAALPAREPVPVGTAAELAALMQGVAALASASGRPVPRDVLREASGAARDALRAARGKPPVSPRNPPWPQQRALAAPRAGR